jgi:hypothetical protein
MRATWFPRAQATISLAAALALLWGCASGDTAAPRAISSNSEGSATPNSFFASLWQNPIADGVAVESLDAEGLVFTPHAPAALGAPLRVVVTEETTVEGPYREVAWVYDDPAYGPFVVVERIVNESGATAEIQELSTHTPGCSPTPVSEEELGEGAYAEACTAGYGSLETLKDGTSALEFVGGNTTFVAWVEALTFPSSEDESAVTRVLEFSKPALYIQVIGPSPDFTKEDALAVANGV